MAHVDYYFTLNSPWSYLGAARFRDILKKHGATVAVKPAKFGPIFEKTGGLPLPKRSPERRAYRLMELKRWREATGVPITIEPKYFPSDETKGTRLVLAAARSGLDALTLSLEIARAVWEREESFADDAVLQAACARAGVDKQMLDKVAPAEELDQEHDRLTAEALSRGVFGAPSYVLDSGEFFWGQDRLEFLDRALAKLPR
jgi:2-hydroxychromene-2-carboxylate isomerase